MHLINWLIKQIYYFSAKIEPLQKILDYMKKMVVGLLNIVEKLDLKKVLVTLYLFGFLFLV